MVNVAKTTNIDVAGLPAEVPADSGRYHIFWYKHTHEGDYMETPGEQKVQRLGWLMLAFGSYLGDAGKFKGRLINLWSLTSFYLGSVCLLVGCLHNIHCLMGPVVVLLLRSGVHNFG